MLVVVVPVDGGRRVVGCGRGHGRAGGGETELLGGCCGRCGGRGGVEGLPEAGAAIAEPHLDAGLSQLGSRAETRNFCL